MHKKWLLTAMSVLVLATVSVGCNNNGPDPAPPDNVIEDVKSVPGNEESIPGVDENDTLNRDDENDANQDPEDNVEDVQDIDDNNNNDQ